MKMLLLLAALVVVAQAATMVDPKDCTAYPCLIFDDDFDFLDLEAWEHEMTIGGGGNWEFQGYINNRSITYTHDSTLFIKPGLTADLMGEEFLTTGVWDIWGAGGHNDKCTGNAWSGCERRGVDGTLNPIISGRLRTLPFFAVRYGRVEVRAKMPSGAWIWPAVWMLPKNFGFGPWPASGEIDILESRGNLDYGDQGVQYAGSTLHWGPNWQNNRFDLTTSHYSPSVGSFADDFHTWALEWTENDIKVYVDDVEVLAVDPVTNFWDFGGFESTGFENPWRYGSKMTPFDEKFSIILNVAVGGTNGFFPDEVPSNPPKPWANSDTDAPAKFWADRDNWLPTWQHGEGKVSEKAAMQVDYVRVYKLADN